MNKSIALSLAVAASFALTACGQEAAENAVNEAENAAVTAENAAADAMNAAENATDATANAVENAM
jgi:hypothetical protein